MRIRPTCGSRPARDSSESPRPAADQGETVRVVAGSARGCRIRVPRGDLVRPTQDRVRESLFMILGYPLNVSAAVDLFAGSGALGIEALSRGAEFVTFVDRNTACLEAIRENLARCGFLQRAAVHRAAIPRDYAGIRRAVARQYDLVLLDPPYRLRDATALLTGLHRCSLLRENARIVLEHSTRHLVRSVPAPFAVQDQRAYGDTALTFFVYRRGEAPSDENGKTA